MNAVAHMILNMVGAAAMIPFLAASGISRAEIMTGVLGIFVTLFEGMLRLNRYHENWIRYRSAGTRSSKYDQTNFLCQKNDQCS
jgi:hypothetical protein